VRGGAYAAWRADRDRGPGGRRRWPRLGIGVFSSILDPYGFAIQLVPRPRAGWQAGPMGTRVFYAFYRRALMDCAIPIPCQDGGARALSEYRHLASTATAARVDVYAAAYCSSDSCRRRRHLPGLLLRGFPLFAIVAAGVSRPRFIVIVTLVAVAMCVLTVASTTIAGPP